jgi:hypothetical protein
MVFERINDHLDAGGCFGARDSRFVAVNLLKQNENVYVIESPALTPAIIATSPPISTSPLLTRRLSVMATRK